MQSQKPRIRPSSGLFPAVKSTVSSLGLKTVCQESHCPNQSECWSGGTATFMVLGDTCTRACKFCNVKTFHRGQPLDREEPEKLAEAAKEWGLEYVVVTSVDRDDLEDQGAGHFSECIQALKRQGIRVEALIPDFGGSIDSLRKIVSSSPDVIAHNLETVASLQRKVRDPRAGYRQSLRVLERVKNLNPSILTKSSLMLGLGESDQEVLKAMQDLRERGVDILTLGQYLQPSSRHLPVESYVPREKWTFFSEKGEGLGLVVESGPLVRSSYKAGEIFRKFKRQ